MTAPHRSRLSVTILAAVLLATVMVAACAPQSPGGSGGTGGSSSSPGLGGCPLFPADNVWHADVSQLPEHARSSAWRVSIGAGGTLWPDFGSGLWNGGRIGIPWTGVDAGQARVPMSFYYDDESDPGPYPIPADAPVEAGSDHHVIVVDRSECQLYESFDSARQVDGSWTAGSGARWDLRSNALRPDGWTSADAAGLPILAGLVRYEEVAAGRIDHAIRFTAPRTQRSYLWPARHFASSSTDPNLPPMGAWFRLRADYDTSTLSPQARVVADALKRHGMILSDNGSPWMLTGAPDERWDNQGLRDLTRINASDLEAVDVSSLMIDPNSAQMRITR